MNDEKNTEFGELQPEEKESGTAAGEMPENDNAPSEPSCEIKPPPENEAAGDLREDEYEVGSGDLPRAARKKIQKLESELEGLKKQLEAADALS